MGKHDLALVPIECWAYSGPDVRILGRQVDFGLAAEALLYYDRVMLSIGNRAQFAEFLSHLIASDDFASFISLLRDGTITLLDFGFVSTAIELNDTYLMMNVQDELTAKPGTFAQRILYGSAIEAVVPKSRQRESLYKAVRGRVIEAKAESYGRAVDNARGDIENDERLVGVVQAFVDEVHAVRRLGAPPRVEIRGVVKNENGSRTIDFNIDFNKLTALAGPIGFAKASPFTAVAVANRNLEAAAQYNCDLFLNSPMSRLTAAKLYETVGTPVREGEIVQSLKEEVEFPDIRKLANSGSVTFGDVLALRRKAKRFRDWLAVEGERDRNAIIAYHHEVAKDAGLQKFGKSTLRLLSIFGPPTAGAIGAAKGDAVAGAFVGAGVRWLSEMASKMIGGWRPVMFGEWMSSRVEKIQREKGSE